MVSVAVWSAADRPAESYQATYIGLGLLAALLLVILIKAYRVWEEIHDVDEPPSPAELLASFEQAHAAGEMDDQELERVRERLRRSSTLEEPASSSPSAGGATPPPAAPGPLLDHPDLPVAADQGARGDP